MNVPGHVTDVRRTACLRYDCQFLDQLDYADPCLKCPDGHFGIYRLDDCGRTLSPKPPPRGDSFGAEPWPLFLLMLKPWAKPFDRGAGDIIARVIGPIGGNAFKKWYRLMFGKKCGCDTRQAELNQRWPTDLI